MPYPKCYKGFLLVEDTEVDTLAVLELATGEKNVMVPAAPYVDGTLSGYVMWGVEPDENGRGYAPEEVMRRWVNNLTHGG